MILFFFLLVGGALVGCIFNKQKSGTIFFFFRNLLQHVHRRGFTVLMIFFKNACMAPCPSIGETTKLSPMAAVSTTSSGDPRTHRLLPLLAPARWARTGRPGPARLGSALVAEPRGAAALPVDSPIKSYSCAGTQSYRQEGREP